MGRSSDGERGCVACCPGTVELAEVCASWPAAAAAKVSIDIATRRVRRILVAPETRRAPGGINGIKHLAQRRDQGLKIDPPREESHYLRVKSSSITRCHNVCQSLICSALRAKGQVEDTSYSILRRYLSVRGPFEIADVEASAHPPKAVEPADSGKVQSVASPYENASRGDGGDVVAIDACRVAETDREATRGGVFGEGGSTIQNVVIVRGEEGKVDVAVDSGAERPQRPSAPDVGASEEAREVLLGGVPELEFSRPHLGPKAGAAVVEGEPGTVEEAVRVLERGEWEGVVTSLRDSMEGRQRERLVYQRRAIRLLLARQQIDLYIRWLKALRRELRPSVRALEDKAGPGGVLQLAGDAGRVLLACDNTVDLASVGNEGVAPTDVKVEVEVIEEELGVAASQVTELIACVDVRGAREERVLRRGIDGKDGLLRRHVVEALGGGKAKRDSGALVGRRHEELRVIADVRQLNGGEKVERSAAKTRAAQVSGDALAGGKRRVAIAQTFLRKQMRGDQEEPKRAERDPLSHNPSSPAAFVKRSGPVREYHAAYNDLTLRPAPTSRRADLPNPPVPLSPITPAPLRADSP